MRRIFLDHQATTPVLPEVRVAMEPFLQEQFGSPSSFHAEGLGAREAVAAARAQVAGLIHAETPDDIIFTASASESANLAIKGVAWTQARRGRHIVCSATEHPAVSESVKFLEQQGWTATRVGVDAGGGIDPAAVKAALTDQTVLICVHHVSHDLGTIEPMAEIGQVAAEHGCALFVDAIASGGWVPIDVRRMQASLLSLSPHRFYGPKGVGVLYRHRRTRLTSLVHGGTQESGLRAGVENVQAIVGAGVAAEIAGRELASRAAHVGSLQERLWTGMQGAVRPVRLNGPAPGPRRSPASLNVSIEFIEGEGLVLALDLQGVAIHAGPACLARSSKVPPSLEAIGLPVALAQASVTFSPGKDNTPDEIDRALQTLASTTARLRAMSPLWEQYQRGARPSLIEGPAGSVADRG